MTSKQRMRNAIEHKNIDQMAVTFNDLTHDDTERIESDEQIISVSDPKYKNWGYYPELLEKCEDFNGEVRLDSFGNIIGRLNQLTKGECVYGCVSDWDNLDNYTMPKINTEFFKNTVSNKKTDKYLIAVSPFAVFSNLRDARLMTNALMDILLEPEKVEDFLQEILKRNLEIIENIKDTDVDALMFFDDWGTQDRTFISPDSFREFFKPIYKAIGDKLHSYGKHLIVHSCGYNYAFMEDFIEVGIDVLQFDQLGAYGYEKMAEEFSHRVVFWSPLDIQKTLPTGDETLIKSEALKMINAFKESGSLIMKDYPSYKDIGVEEEWASWAREIFLENIAY